MSIKQVKIIKVIRLILLSTGLYLTYNQRNFDIGSKTSYIFISPIIILCAASLGSLIPREYQFGSTFLDSKFKWLEFMLEVTMMTSLTFILNLF